MTTILPAVWWPVDRSVNISVTPLIIHQTKLNYLLELMELGSHGFCKLNLVTCFSLIWK